MIEHPIGIMHGRLSPPFEGRFQAFPAVSWREEFARAREAGLQQIEWIYERPHRDDNPLLTASGIAEINRLQQQSGVAVRSICADFYMTDHLLRDDATPDEANVADLLALLPRAAAIDARYIVLPFVDSSSLQHRPAMVVALAGLLHRLAPAAAAQAVELHLETDLLPAPFAALLAELNHPHVRANYDTGNSSGLGYDPNEELPLLGPYLGSVHIKDRLRGGGTVPPGTGSADFPACFRQFARLGYDRHFILQTARGVPGDEVSLARQHRQFVLDQLASVKS